jgi:hypothetical protein
LIEPKNQLIILIKRKLNDELHNKKIKIFISYDNKLNEIEVFEKDTILNLKKE